MKKMASKYKNKASRMAHYECLQAENIDYVPLPPDVSIITFNARVHFVYECEGRLWAGCVDLRDVRRGFFADFRFGEICCIKIGDKVIYRG